MKYISMFLYLLVTLSAQSMEKKEKSSSCKLAPATAINKKYLKKAITKPGRLAELVDPGVAEIGLDHPSTAHLEKPSSVNWRALAKRISQPGRLTSYVDSQVADIGTDSSQP